MFEVTINGKTVKAEMSFYTAWLYESEFQKDMISDFYGVQELDPMAGAEDGTFKVDFTKANWNAAIRVLWAAIKTADETVPPFHQWMRRTSGIDTWTLRQQIDEAIADCFFRAEIAGEEA